MCTLTRFARRIYIRNIRSILFYTILKYKYEERKRESEEKRGGEKNFNLDRSVRTRNRSPSSPSLHPNRANIRFTGMAKNAGGEKSARRPFERMIHWLEMVSHGD